MYRFLFFIPALVCGGALFATIECNPGEFKLDPRDGGEGNLRPLVDNLFSMSSFSEQRKLLSLMKGIRVTGEHRAYPDQKTQTRRSKFTGKITDFRVLDRNLDEVTDQAASKSFVLVIERDGRGNQIPDIKEYVFTDTASPMFEYLQTENRQAPSGPLGELAIAAQNGWQYQLDILAIGADTPEQTAEYKRSLRAQNALAFYGSRSVGFRFNNFYGAPFFLDDKWWPTSEHFFQAMKFAPTDPNYAEKIRLAQTPAEAAELGRNRDMPLRPDWESVRYEIMLKALKAKYSQDELCYRDLIESGDRPLVEHTENDSVWGDGEDGTGLSLLGKALMEIRGQIKAGQIKTQFELRHLPSFRSDVTAGKNGSFFINAKN